MMDQHFLDKTFDKATLAASLLLPGEYDNCTFNGGDFSNADFSGFRFSDCTFRDCNLSMVKTNKTAFRDIRFTGCKMLGMRFDNCNDLGLSFSFDQCTLNHSSFFKTKIKKTVFKNSQLREVDFSECDLSGSLFDNCDFTDASFDRTILEKADLRSSFNYSIDPAINRVKKAKFALPAVIGLLDKYDIEIER